MSTESKYWISWLAAAWTRKEIHRAWMTRRKCQDLLESRPVSDTVTNQRKPQRRPWHSSQQPRRVLSTIPEDIMKKARYMISCKELTHPPKESLHLNELHKSGSITRLLHHCFTCNTPERYRSEKATTIFANLSRL